MASTELESLWQAVFPEKSRPSLYASNIEEDDGFLPLSDHKDFAMDIHALTTQQLYTFAANSHIALKAAQDEYLELEQRISIIKNPDPTNQQPIKNPQSLLDSVENEQRKEALLYGYKYDGKRYFGNKKLSELSDMEKRDLRMDQDPFAQGGFVPNDRQFKAAKAKAKYVNNIDGWTPIERNSHHVVPKMFIETPTDHAERYNLARSKTFTGARGLERAVTEDRDDLSTTGTPLPVNKLLRNTRFNGTKVPLTRDTSEEPSYSPSRSSTPKRKRGDTPLSSFEDGSPLKKVRASALDEGPRRRRHNQYTKAKERREQAENEMAGPSVRETMSRIVHLRLNGALHDSDLTLRRSATTEASNISAAETTPPRRKRHNQYTKAKERAGLAVAGGTADVTPPIHTYDGSTPAIGSNNYIMPTIEHHEPLESHAQFQPALQSLLAVQEVNPAVNGGGNNRPPVWANMTAAQKLHHKWDSESLIAAIKEDYSWLPEENEALKRAERDRLLAQKNPHRSFSIKNKWRFWKKEGLDKRPRKNKLVAIGGDGGLTGDEGFSTPGPLSEVELDHDDILTKGLSTRTADRNTDPLRAVRRERGFYEENSDEDDDEYVDETGTRLRGRRAAKTRD